MLFIRRIFNKKLLLILHNAILCDLGEYINADVNNYEIFDSLYDDKYEIYVHTICAIVQYYENFDLIIFIINNIISLKENCIDDVFLHEDRKIANGVIKYLYYSGYNIDENIIGSVIMSDHSDLLRFLNPILTHEDLELAILYESFKCIKHILSSGIKPNSMLINKFNLDCTSRVKKYLCKIIHD